MITSLYQSLCNMETNIADRVALRWYDEEKQGVAEVHYAQYAQDLRRFVAFLRAEYGDVRGKRVAILARNSYQYVICMYGTVIAGAVAVPLNLGKDWDAISYELGLTEPVCILQDGEFAEREPALTETYGSILKPMDAFSAYEPAEDVTEVENLSALAFIMFTSGTTGRSKGVMLSQKNLFSAMPAFLNPFDDVKKYTGWNTDEFSSLSALPMFHISAMTSLVSWSITGHSINLCNNLKYFYRDLGSMHRRRRSRSGRTSGPQRSPSPSYHSESWGRTWQRRRSARTGRSDGHGGPSSRRCRCSSAAPAPLPSPRCAWHPDHGRNTSGCCTG